MTSITERLLKRQRFDVTVGDEVFSVRELPVADLQRIDTTIEDMVLRSYFIIGRSLVTDEVEYQQPTGESDVAYAERMQAMLGGMGTATLAQLTSAITRLGITPKQETLRKN